MQCFHPIRIRFKFPKYNVITGETITEQSVPCGRCEACLERKRVGWFIRLREQLKSSSSAYFITLTYQDYYLPSKRPYLIGFDKRQVQLFLKRFRKLQKTTNIKYFLVAEYGTDTFRPHYHMHLFNAIGGKTRIYEDLLKCWPFGNITIGDFTDSRNNYVAAHVSVRHGLNSLYQPPFRLVSKNLGIAFLDSHKNFYEQSDKLRIYYDWNGKKLSLPRYYQDKIWSQTSNLERGEYLSKNEKIPTKEQQDEFKYKFYKRRKNRRKL